MYQYHCLNPIATCGLEQFTPDYTSVSAPQQAQAILVRSASMHELPLSETVLAVARAGAGVNNIPLQDYAAQGIVVFNTPGANANGVKELVLAGLFLASRDIIGGVNWVQSQR
ncbi:MAG: 3-phosphoglycerate dehydrogenase, partial [Oscillospiraceae bacterium]